MIQEVKTAKAPGANISQNVVPRPTLSEIIPSACNENQMSATCYTESNSWDPRSLYLNKLHRHSYEQQCVRTTLMETL